MHNPLHKLLHNLLAWKIAALFAISLWLIVAFTISEPLRDWHEGELVIILPTAEMEVESAFEAELVALFAKQLVIKVKPVSLAYDQVIPALLQHKAHFAAAGLGKKVDPEVIYSDTYQILNEKAICDGSSPAHLSDLLDHSLVVSAGSPQETALLAVKAKIPSLHWEARKNQSAVSLLQQVAEGNVECTVANDEQLELARNFYPDLGDALDLASPSQLAWAFPPDADKSLQLEVHNFFERIKHDGTLRRMIDSHYGHNERLPALDAVAFVTKTRTVLPHYRRWFEEAASLTGIDWKLLAALSYRESHWDPLAKSYTNVRGIMMLTEDTADQMNVEDRLEPHSSILAGAHYLQMMKEQLPLNISEDDRLWMALAAYNQGMRHLEDARILAKQAGLNPDAWADVKKVMPLLSRPAYYKKTKYGQARGGEAVILVETVRMYQDMLNRMSLQDLQMPALPYYGLIGKRSQVKLPE